MIFRKDFPIVWNRKNRVELILLLKNKFPDIELIKEGGTILFVREEVDHSFVLLSPINSNSIRITFLNADDELTKAAIGVLLTLDPK
ncbi:MAG: hypothetical protein H6581_14775 [Bacteroidia bacterium]|nr:hypothetical protein [Bacteroidia bacterium]